MLPSFIAIGTHWPERAMEGGLVTLPLAASMVDTRVGGLRVAHFSDTYLPRRDGVVTSLHTLTGALAAGGHTCLTVVPRHRDQVDRPGLLRLVAVPCGVADLRLLPWPAARHV